MVSAWRRTARAWGGVVALALAFVAVLALAAATPEHVLDRDEDTGSAIAAVHPMSRTVVDHRAPGHACAGHCAAHVMGELTAGVPVTHAEAAVRLAWRADRQAGAPSLGGAPPDRPPRA